MVPDGLQFKFYGDMFVDDWKVPEYNPQLAQDLLKQAGYKGDPIPYRLLNNYYTNQTANGQVMVEMWKQVGLNVQIEMKENWAQIHDPEGVKGVRDWSTSASFNDPVTPLVTQHGPNGEQQQKKDWTNAEMNELSVVLETSTDRAAPQEGLRPHAGDLRARGPGLPGPAPERRLHRQKSVAEVEGRTCLRHGLPQRQLGHLTGPASIRRRNRRRTSLPATAAAGERSRRTRH